MLCCCAILGHAPYFWKLPLEQNAAAQKVLEAPSVAHCSASAARYNLMCWFLSLNLSWHGCRLSEEPSHLNGIDLPPIQVGQKSMLRCCQSRNSSWHGPGEKPFLHGSCPLEHQVLKMRLKGLLLPTLTAPMGACYSRGG